jgi:hypothetical protein
MADVPAAGFYLMAGVPAAVVRDISVAGFVDNTQEQQVPGADKQNITYK